VGGHNSAVLHGEDWGLVEAGSPSWEVRTRAKSIVATKYQGIFSGPVNGREKKLRHTLRAALTAPITTES